MTVPSRSAVRVRVPAKINLHLGVGPLRNDKFHDLATVFHAVSVYDEIVAEPGPPGIHLVLAPASPTEHGSLAVHRAGGSAGGVDVSGVPIDASNLAVRALDALAKAANIEPATTVTLRKGIPVAGGMAGGSADAAGALIAGDALWELATPREKLFQLAAELGSDVAFALHGGDALGTGRGERLATLRHPYGRHWVLATTTEGLSTPAVYRELDRQRGPQGRASDPTPVVEALDDPDPTALARALANDLQAAALALRPGLRAVLDGGMDAGALGGLVSGSGPTCAFLAADAEHAIQLAKRLEEAEIPGVGAVLVAHGPVAGAELLSAAVS